MKILSSHATNLLQQLAQFKADKNEPISFVRVQLKSGETLERIVTGNDENGFFCEDLLGQTKEMIPFDDIREFHSHEG